MRRAYVAALYSHFHNPFYTIRYLDFNDRRGPDGARADLKNIESMQVGLQKLVDEMQASGKNLPEPVLKEYESYTFGDVHYVTNTKFIQRYYIVVC